MSDETYDDWSDEPLLPPALGTVVDEARGALPYALLHGEALVACAAWGLGESGVTPVDTGTPWSSLVAGGEPFVLHDSLCPMTPGAFITACVARCLETDAVVVGVRPVTDTIKVVHDGVIGETLDRESLWAVTSPVVLPARVVAELEPLGGVAGLAADLDLAALVGALRARGPVETLEAPAEGRRVASPEDVEVLAALTLPDGLAPHS